MSAAQEAKHRLTPAQLLIEAHDFCLTNEGSLEDMEELMNRVERFRRLGELREQYRLQRRS